MTTLTASSTLQQAFEAATVAALETLTHIAKQRDNLREARMAATEILRMARGMFTPSVRDESASSRQTTPERTNNTAQAGTPATPPPAARCPRPARSRARRRARRLGSPARRARAQGRGEGGASLARDRNPSLARASRAPTHRRSTRHARRAL